MNTRTLFKKLRLLASQMQADHVMVNYGGCCVFAYLVGEKLQALGYDVEIVTPFDNGWYASAASVRESVGITSNADDWCSEGVSFCHVAVRFKTVAGQVYTYDSEYFRRGGRRFGDYYDADPEFGTGLTVAEARAICQTQEGWNREFDRDEIPEIKSKINKLFPEQLIGA